MEAMGKQVMISQTAPEARTPEAPPGMRLRSAFANTGIVFSALDALESYARRYNLATGQLQARAPIGVMRGLDHIISTWRNMSPTERAALDGQVLWGEGGPREGSAMLYMRPAPAELAPCGALC